MIDQVAAKMSEAERAAREAELARLEQEREASQQAFDNQMMLEKMRLEASSKAAESARSAAAEVSLSGITPGIENISYYPSTTSFTFGVNLNF